MRGRSIGTGTLPTGAPGASRRGEEGLRTVFGTATLPTGTPEASSRGEGGLLTSLRHGDLAHRYSRGIPAWRRGLLTGLRHGNLAHRYSRGIQAWRDRHQSHVAPARDIHRAGSQCPQTPQRQIALRGEANWTSPSKRLCPTPTWKGISRLDRQDK